MARSFDLSSPDIIKQGVKFDALPAWMAVNIKRFAQLGGAIVLTGWEDVSARDTNFYADTLEMEVTEIASTLPEAQTVVFTNVRSPQGFPYPRALEESTRYHYRATARKGQRTAGQVTRMFKKKEDPLDSLLAVLGNKTIDFLVIG